MVTFQCFNDFFILCLVLNIIVVYAINCISFRFIDGFNIFSFFLTCAAYNQFCFVQRTQKVIYVTLNFNTKLILRWVKMILIWKLVDVNETINYHYQGIGLPHLKYWTRKTSCLYELMWIVDACDEVWPRKYNFWMYY